MSAALLTGTVRGERVALAALGAWTADRAAELETVIEETAQRYKDARAVDIDLAQLERLDMVGAWLIERLTRSFTARGSIARVVNLSETDRGLMDEVHRVNRAPAAEATAGNRILVGLDSIGR